MSHDDSSVHVVEHVSLGGQRIGIITLNAPRTLNALTRDMIIALDQQLKRWRDDPTLALVILEGSGARAFCAGGDVRQVVASVAAQTEPHMYATDFFSREYTLDYAIHRYPKPLLVWGHGVVMGGGLGLMVGARHRVVTASTHIAMPEVRIGLYPDVGASYFLNQLPGRIGLFLALTGAPLNARDALDLGLADYAQTEASAPALYAHLASLSWHANAAENHAQLAALLTESGQEVVLPPAQIMARQEEINALCAGDSQEEIVTRLTHYQGDDTWLQSSCASLRTGSPTSMALAWESLQRAQGLSLAEVFRMELILSVQCCAHPDFAEGVRAHLLDKDHAPHWTPAELKHVDRRWIDTHFCAPWGDAPHPLRHLESGSSVCKISVL